eukprot:3449516-Pyramimonas_sp.AAC.2
MVPRMGRAFHDNKHTQRCASPYPAIRETLTILSYIKLCYAILYYTMPVPSPRARQHLHSESADAAGSAPDVAAGQLPGAAPAVQGVDGADAGGGG